MNRRKRTSNIGLPTLILLLVALAIVSSGGIGYVIMKNKQVTARREIAQVQERMQQHKVLIDLHKTDIERILDVYGVSEKLTVMQSSLVEIPSGVVEVYVSPDQEASPERVMAQR